MRYRDFNISHNPKPIPLRWFDWEYTHVDYDGPEDARSGVGESWRECVDEINDCCYDEEPKRFFTIGDGGDGSVVISGDDKLFEIALHCYGRRFVTLLDRCKRNRYTTPAA